MTSKVNDKISISAPKDLSLGKQVEYEFHYNPDLLQGVPRSLSRDTLSLDAEALPFKVLIHGLGTNCLGSTKKESLT
jgi:7-cyano-7-deazaguanine reductase